MIPKNNFTLNENTDIAIVKAFLESRVAYRMNIQEQKALCRVTLALVDAWAKDRNGFEKLVEAFAKTQNPDA